MNRQQRTALRHPALLAEETLYPRTHWATALGTITLTINTGYE